MDAVGAASYEEYLDHLELHPDEFALLFNTILINVTGFFRDPQAWEFLAQDVLPRLLEAIPDQAPVRVWCAGCASGEEAYTTAMLLAEALGEHAYTERVKLYATDVDEEALSAGPAGHLLGEGGRGRAARAPRALLRPAPTSAGPSARTCAGR